MYYYPYIKSKTYITSSSSRGCGEVENWDNLPVVTGFRLDPSC
jgi:hypothetical protein